MADKIIQELEIRVDNERAKGNVKDFEKTMTSSFLKADIAVRALVKSFELAFNWLQKSVEQAALYEKTTKQLTVTLNRLGDQNGLWLDALQKQASELQNVTGHSDEVIRQLQIMGLNMGVASDKIRPLIQASVSLANVHNKDVTEAFRQVAKTTSGMAGELGELLPQVKSLTKEQLIAGEAMNLINDTMGDQLSALTEGIGGSKVNLINAWQDLSEQTSIAAVKILELDKSLQFITDRLRVLQEVGFMSFAFMDAGEFDQQINALRQIDKLQARVAEREAAKQVGILKSGGRAGARGGGGRKGSGGPEIEFGLAEGGGEFISQERDRLNARIDAISEFNKKRIEMQADLQEELARMDDDAMENQFSSMQFHIDGARQASQAAASIVSQQLIGLIQGNEDAMKKSAKGFAGTMINAAGNTLVARGVAGLAEAAILAFTPGAQANAAGMAAASGKAIGVGAALAVAGKAIGGDAVGGGLPNVGGGGGTGGGASGFVAGGTTESGETKPSTIIVNVSGAFSQAEAGREIQEALTEARRIGL